MQNPCCRHQLISFWPLQGVYVVRVVRAIHGGGNERKRALEVRDEQRERHAAAAEQRMALVCAPAAGSARERQQQ